MEQGTDNETQVDSSSKANVQALLAIFAQKDQPLMGMLKPGCKINSNKSLNRQSSNSSICDKNGNETVLMNSMRNSLSPEKTNKLSVITHHKECVSEFDNCSDSSSTITEKSSPSASPSPSAQNTLKPLLKPKPIIAQKPIKSLSANLNKLPKKELLNDSLLEEKTNQEVLFPTKENKNKTSVGELAVAISQMLERSSSQQSLTNSKTLLAKTFEKHPNALGKEGNSSSSQNSSPTSLSLSLSKFIFDECSFTQDNYICKNNKKYKRKKLPPKEKLGNAPLKPVKPSDVRLTPSSSICTYNPPPLPERSFKQVIPSENSIAVVPVRPSRSAPPPPKISKGSKIETCSYTEEELYIDTASPSEEKTRPVSMIPEYTEEEELGNCNDDFDLEELYADGEAEGSLLVKYPLPMKPNKPPPAIPETSPEEELYQDAIDPDQEEVYEEMPIDLHLDEQDTSLYTNRKDQDKSRRDEEKRQRKEQKEQEKREKGLLKLKKKYGLTGEEIPVDTGLVKADSRGGWYDLSVRKGETVLILRMENNPSGKWLVKNEKGKIGYVELTNIEVDADSIKSVMSVRRTSTQSASEELYCDATVEEAIYEETY